MSRESQVGLVLCYSAFARAMHTPCMCMYTGALLLCAVPRYLRARCPPPAHRTAPGPCAVWRLSESQTEAGEGGEGQLATPSRWGGAVSAHSRSRVTMPPRREGSGRAGLTAVCGLPARTALLGVYGFIHYTLILFKIHTSVLKLNLETQTECRVWRAEIHCGDAEADGEWTVGSGESEGKWAIVG